MSPGLTSSSRLGPASVAIPGRFHPLRGLSRTWRRNNCPNDQSYSAWETPCRPPCVRPVIAGLPHSRCKPGPVHSIACSPGRSLRRRCAWSISPIIYLYCEVLLSCLSSPNHGKCYNVVLVAAGLMQVVSIPPAGSQHHSTWPPRVFAYSGHGTINPLNNIRITHSPEQ